MTTIPGLLADLRRRKVYVSVIDDRLRLEAPTGTITPELRAEVARLKVGILETLNTAHGSTNDIQEIQETRINCISSMSSVPRAENLAPSSDYPCNALCHLESRISQARDWQDLHAVVADADMAYVSGAITGEEVDSLCEMARREAQCLPEYSTEPPSGRDVER